MADVDSILQLAGWTGTPPGASDLAVLARVSVKQISSIIDFREAGMTPEEILKALKDGVLKRDAIANAKNAQASRMQQMLLKKQQLKNRGGAVSNAEIDNMEGRLRSKEEELKALEEKGVRQNRFDFFRKLDDQVRKNDKLATQVKEQRKKGLEERKAAHAQRKALAAAAGSADFTDSEEERALAEEEKRIEEEPVMAERRVAKTSVPKPTVAAGAALRGTEKDEEVWGEAVGTDEQQVARAEQWSAALDAEYALTLSAKERLDAEAARRQEDTELNLGECQVALLAANRESELDAAVSRAAALKKEQDLMARGEASQTFFHKNTARFQTLARRADLVALMPRKLRQQAEQVARDYDKALGYSPIECERRSVERTAHLEAALMRAEARKDGQLSVWADDVVRMASSNDRDAALMQARKDDMTQQLGAAERVHASAERLRHLELAWLRLADEKEAALKPADVITYRAMARRADYLVQFPQTYRTICENKLNAEEKEGLPSAEATMRSTQRAEHASRALVRDRINPIHPFALRAVMVVRLPPTAQREELERQRAQDAEMDLSADQCQTRHTLRRALLDAARGVAADEQAEGDDVALFRLFAVRADALVRGTPQRQQLARARYLQSLEKQRGVSKAAVTQGGVDWDRHLTLAEDRFKPTPLDLAILADVLLGATPAERALKENELRAAEGRAQDPSEALHSAALRAHHLELAALRKMDVPKTVAAQDAEQWLEAARTADLLVEKFPTAATQDKELQRLADDDKKYLSPDAAAKAAAARKEHVELARKRQSVLTLPLIAIQASAIACYPRRKQLAEEARLAKADEDIGLGEDELIAAEQRRKLALISARARLVGEEQEVADLRGNAATFRIEALRADTLRLATQNERALMNAAVERVDSMLGVPDDQKGAQKELRTAHLKAADDRTVLCMDQYSFQPQAEKDEALEELQADEELSGVAADVCAARHAEREKALKIASENNEGRAMWLARMRDTRRGVEEERLKRVDMLMGLTDPQIAERAAKRAELLKKALAEIESKGGAANVPVEAAEKRVAEAAAWIPCWRSRHGDTAGLDLDSVAAQLAFAEQADKILSLPAEEQAAAKEKLRDAESKIVGISEAELITRASERARHLELARVRKDDELVQDLDSDSARAAWRALAREADLLVRVTGARKADLEKAIDEREMKMSDAERDNQQLERQLHLDMAEDRRKKCSETTFAAKADGLVRLSKGALAAQERRFEQEDAEAGMNSDDIKINAARRKRELSLARRRMTTEKDDVAAQDLDAAGLAAYRAEALRADKMIRLPADVRADEEVAIDAADIEAGVPQNEITRRQKVRAAHLALAKKRYESHRERIGLNVPTDAELQERHDDGAESDIEPYLADVAGDAVINEKEKEKEKQELVALEQQAEALGKDAGALEMLLEADVAEEMEKQRNNELLAEDEQVVEEEDAEAKMKRLLAEEDEWESEAGIALSGGAPEEPKDDDAPAGGDNAMTKALEENLGVGADQKEEFDTSQKVVVDDGDDDDPDLEPEYESAADRMKAPVVQEIEMGNDVTGGSYMTPTFDVTKFTTDAGWSVRSNLRRKWQLNLWTNNLINMTPAGKIQKTHAGTKILQLEKHVMDTRRLRLMMYDANHSYELLFDSSAERERFYEAACTMRPMIRCYCPTLVPEGSLYAMASVMKKAGDPSAGMARVNCAKKLWERLTVWVGTWDMGGRGPPPLEAAASAEGSPLEFWMPRDKYDVYVCGVQEASYRKHEKEWFQYVGSYLGSGYVLIASMVAGNVLSLISVRKKCLLKMTNIEGVTINNLRTSGNAKECGAVGLAARYLETSFVFVNAKLAQAPDALRLRNTNVKEVFEKVEVGCKEACMSTQFDHAFLFGNLGYRQKLDRAATMKAIDDEDFEKIIEKDELTTLLKGRSLAQGFGDASDIVFRPTFPLVPGTDTFAETEAPSYPDRVLVRTNPHLKKSIFAELYASAEEVTGGSHAPVFATFVVQCRRPVAGLFMGSEDPECVIKLTAAKVSHEGLPPLNKAQLVAWGSCCDAPSMSKPLPKATEWKDKDLPTLMPYISDTAVLRKHSFMVIFRDNSVKDKKKKYRGSAVFSLKEIVDAKGGSVKVTAPLVYMGGQIGTLEFQAEMKPKA